MFRIAISVIGNLADANGTTVRARSIVGVLGKHFNLLIIVRATSVEDKQFASLSVTKSSAVLVKPKGTKLWNLKLIPVVLRNKFSCVYCVADIFGFFTYYVLSRFFKYKIVFEAHALAHKETEQLTKLRAFTYLLLETFIGKNANAIIALSGVTYGFYKRLNKNTFFVPVFIDDGVFKNYRKQCSNEKEKVVGMVGPFDAAPNKHQLEFLQSNSDKFDERIRFKIIGKCDRRLPNSTIEYTGILESTEEYFRALCQLDALLVPVRIATFGPKNKILEAMACGVPVFTTQEGIVGLDFAKPDENIIVCQEDKLVEITNKLLFDEAYLEKISFAAQETVRESYAEQNYSMRFSRIMTTVLTEHDKKETW